MDFIRLIDVTDYIIQKLDPENYQKMMHEWDLKYPKE